MGLKYEPASEPLHISGKQTSFNLWQLQTQTGLEMQESNSSRKIQNVDRAQIESRSHTPCAYVFIVERVQGYLAHKKQRPPRNLQ